MKYALVSMAAIILISGCSGDKGTTSGPDATGLRLSTDRMDFYQAATDSRHPYGRLITTNEGKDTLSAGFQSATAWLKVDHDTISLLPGSADTIVVYAEADSMAVGSYSGRITVINSLLPNSPHYLNVGLSIRPETTWIHLENPSSSWVYAGFQAPSCYHYNVSCGWTMRAFSNAGKNPQVFQFRAIGIGELNHEKVTDILMHSGQLMPGSITFEGCGSAGPPLDAYWYIDVGYRYNGQEHWVEAEFHS